MDTNSGTFYLYFALVALLLMCSCSIGLACCVVLSWTLASKYIDKRVHSIFENQKNDNTGMGLDYKERSHKLNYGL